MDDPARIDVASDSTMAIVEELGRRGHVVDLCRPFDLRLRDDVLLTCIDGSPGLGRVDQYDAVLIRADPPFDTEYLQATLMLEHVRDRCIMVNDPRALRETNEKLYALRFPRLTPPTLVSSCIAELRDFLQAQDGAVVLKPLDGCGGSGIFLARDDDPNLGAILETATRGGQRRTVAQRYLLDATVGDKRVLLLDGRPIGAFLRQPDDRSARANLHAGGRAVLAQLTLRDRQICEEVGARCRAEGLVLVGLDIIGDWLTEVNVTSPAGFRPLHRLTGRRPEGDVAAWLERVAADQLALAC